MFSILIPSFNRHAEIPALLQSLESQTVKNFEVVVVDDCSNQPLEIQGNFSFPVTLLRNPKNRGAAASRNIAAAAAKHDWLLFLDDDDRFHPEKCQRLAEVIAESPLCNFLYHPAECVMVNEGFSYITRPYEDEKMLTLENILGGNKIGGMPMLAIHRSLFEQVGGLAEDLLSLEDYDFVLKLLSHPEFHPKYLPQPLTRCSFETRRKSVSTHVGNTEKALAVIGKKYVKTAEQQRRFAINSLYILSYPFAMSLSRRAGNYYFEMFKLSKNIKHLAIACASWLSPKLAIQLKRFI